MLLLHWSTEGLEYNPVSSEEDIIGKTKKNIQSIIPIFLNIFT
jgi:hypothetical protein